MARQKGTANFSGTLEVLAGGPIDSRTVVPTLADLTTASNFPYAYVGMETYVVAEDKKYRLIGADVTQSSNWEEVGSGGGSSVSPYTSNPAMNGIASPGSSDNYARGDHVHPSDTAKLGTSGDGSNVTATFTAASSRANISTGEKLSVIFGKIAKFFADLKTVAFSGSYNDLSNKLTAGTNIAISNANVISTTSTYTMRYSTSEQVVGTWIDGKPVYQKVIDCGALPSATSKNVNTGITNMSYLINIEGVAYRASDGTGFPINRPSPMSNGQAQTGAICCSVRTNGTVLQVQTDTDRSNMVAYVILQYTKTTD